MKHPQYRMKYPILNQWSKNAAKYNVKIRKDSELSDMLYKIYDLCCLEIFQAISV